MVKYCFYHVEKQIFVEVLLDLNNIITVRLILRFPAPEKYLLYLFGRNDLKVKPNLFVLWVKIEQF